MKKLFIIFLLITVQVMAEEPKLDYSGETINGVKIDDDKWTFNTKDGEYALVKASYINEMNEKIKLLLAKVEFDQKIIAAKDEVIKKVDEFEAKADEHINIQRETIEKADELFRGYKDLYRDLKAIAGFTNFSLIPGVGFLYFGEKSPALFGSLGFGYKNLFAQFSYGRKYGSELDRDFNTSFGGFLLGWRIPIM